MEGCVDRERCVSTVRRFDFQKQNFQKEKVLIKRNVKERNRAIYG